MDCVIGNCPVCNSNSTKIYSLETRDAEFYECPVCGSFELDSDSAGDIDQNHLASYLFYHAFPQGKGQQSCYYTELEEEYCTEIRNANKGNRYPIHMDAQIIENWYPNTFSEKIDKILLYLGEHEKHFGETQRFSHTKLKVLLFIDLIETDAAVKPQWRDAQTCAVHAKKMLRYLKEEHYIGSTTGLDGEENIYLEANGYRRIDELQKGMSSSKDALVAMQFGNETKAVREAIRKGIKDAGYNPIIYDEVENNDYIMPELLKSIRDSRFVVADLTDDNEGAYFEEGYAMGLGKPVIQLCKKDITPHFDAAQKNTIVFETIEELSEKLTKRIKATIE